MASNGYAPRLKVRYREELVASLQRQLGFANVNEVPRLEKIVVNMALVTRPRTAVCWMLPSGT